MSWIARKMPGWFFKGMINPFTLGAGALMVVLFLSRRPERMEIMPYSRYVELQQRQDAALGMPPEPPDKRIPPGTPIRVWTPNGFENLVKEWEEEAAVARGNVASQGLTSDNRTATQ